MDETRELLMEEIKDELNNLSSLTPGSKEHSEALESLTKLYKLKVEENRIELDYEEKAERRQMEKDHHFDGEEAREREEAFKREQLEEDKKNRYIGLGMDIAGLVLPLMFYASWMRKGFKFEETGTFTSTTFRGLFNRFHPKK